jgi:hypothetical protein
LEQSQLISINDVKWSRYKVFEGPVFIGNMPVPSAGRDAPFHAKVLAVTAAAEGGGFNAVQMWDSGLLSVGAIQFIDAGSFNVCNMLGEVAERCGLDILLDKLKPALDMCNATFAKGADGKWRFYLDNIVVNTAALQKQLYFGDTHGNALGSYTDVKRLRTKTWVVCMANVWDIPGATDVQMEFTLRNLKNGFVWGNLKNELFSPGVSDDGYLGATKAMLLAYAVNAPAVVVKMYDSGKSNGKDKFSAAWCLELLRHVVVNGGIDVWKARWGAKLLHIEKSFGVKFPSYTQLIARSWTVAEPTPLPLPQPTPVVESDLLPEPEPKPIPQPEPVPPESFESAAPAPISPTLTRVVPTVKENQYVKMFEFFIAFIKMLIDAFKRARP